MKQGLTIFEFDAVVDASMGTSVHAVPSAVFAWLESLCLRNGEADGASWLRLTQRKGRRSVQVTSYVGVLRAPNGFQIEVLPKIGRDTDQNTARSLLIQMLRCLRGFRHIQTERAELAATRMPLHEVFIREFLMAVQAVVKRGLRSDYVAGRDNVFALRGKLLVSEHLRHNLVRSDRFYTEHDDFLPNRVENRLLHTALQRTLSMTTSQENQRLARELCFVFADIPTSTNLELDFQRIRLDRGMGYYEPALDWTKLILKGLSPLTGFGDAEAPSLLFPMEAVFEAYVEKHLARQLADGFHLKAQVRSHYLVKHEEQQWFWLKPDLLVREGKHNRLVLDTKWKLLDARKATSSDKYQLSQSDFYQLYAYGNHYLAGQGDVVLIYPKTDAFNKPLPVFVFPQSPDLRLWVLPFCLHTSRLLLPDDPHLARLFGRTPDGQNAAMFVR